MRNAGRSCAPFSPWSGLSAPPSWAPVGCLRPWDQLEWGEGSGIVFHACVLEGELRVCSPVSGHLLKPQRRQMKPGRQAHWKRLRRAVIMAPGSGAVCCPAVMWADGLPSPGGPLALIFTFIRPCHHGPRRSTAALDKTLAGAHHFVQHL